MPDFASPARERKVFPIVESDTVPVVGQLTIAHQFGKSVEPGGGVIRASRTTGSSGVDPILPSKIGAVSWQFVLVRSVNLQGITPLFKIGQALNGFGFFLGLGQRRQEHPCKNGDDGDNDQEFDECER